MSLTNLQSTSLNTVLGKLSAAQELAIRKEIHAEAKAARIDSLFQKKYTRQGFNGTVLIAQRG